MDRATPPVTESRRSSAHISPLSLLVWTLLLAAAGSFLMEGLLAEETLDRLMQDVSLVCEPTARITWLTPNADEVKGDFLVRPLIARHADGERRLVLRVFRRASLPRRIESLRFVVDRAALEIPMESCEGIERQSVQGQGFIEDITLDHQDDLIQRIAGAKEASVEFVERGGPGEKHRLLSGDLDNFRRMVALFNLPALPGDEARPVGGEFSSAGDVGFSEPRLIPTSKVLPAYPRLAREERIDAKVTLLCRVRKDGSVGEMRVVDSPEPDAGFRDAAMEAIRQWKYAPGLKDGEPVEAYVTIIVDFSMES
jgi:TonB family protein